MTRALCALAFIATIASSPALAHHSYALYDTTRLVEIGGVVEEFQMISPHSLLKLKSDDGRVYTFEWLGIPAMKRWGLDATTIQKGERLVVGGNPRRDFDETGILNMKSVHRPSDGWKWPNR